MCSLKTKCSFHWSSLKQTCTIKPKTNLTNMTTIYLCTIFYLSPKKTKILHLAVFRIAKASAQGQTLVYKITILSFCDTWNKTTDGQIGIYRPINSHLKIYIQCESWVHCVIIAACKLMLDSIVMTRDFQIPFRSGVVVKRLSFWCQHDIFMYTGHPVVVSWVS